MGVAGGRWWSGERAPPDRQAEDRDDVGVGFFTDRPDQHDDVVTVGLQDGTGQVVAVGKTDLKGSFHLRAGGKRPFRVAVAYSKEFGAKSAPVH